MMILELFITMVAAGTLTAAVVEFLPGEQENEHESKKH